jgi:hypothetical protein
VRTPSRVTSLLFKTDFTVLGQLINASYAKTTERRRNQGLDGGRDLPETAYGMTAHDDVGRLWWTAIGRRAINDVRVEVTRSYAATDPLLTAPAIVVLDAFTGGGNQEARSRTSTTGVELAEALTVQQGSHTWKAGIQFESAGQASIDQSGFGGTFTFGADVERDESGDPVLTDDGLAVPIAPIETYRRTVLGRPGYVPSQLSIVMGNPSVASRQWTLGWFFLDDWSISDQLSLSYGVRQDSQNNIRPGFAVAPRVSLSWIPDEDEQNALKFGAGLFHTPVDAAVTFDTRKLDGVRQQRFDVQHPLFFTTGPLSPVDFRDPRDATVYTKSSRLRMARTFIASVSYERELPWTLSAVVEYEFSRGFDLLRLRNVSEPASDTSGTSPRSSIFQFESTGRSRQQTLLLGLRSDIGSSFSAYANYTLGKRQSDTDGAYSVPMSATDLAAEFGAMAGDQRHELVAGATAQLPHGVNLMPSVTFATGRPFNITTGRDDNNDTIFNDRPAFALPGEPGAITTRYGLLNPNPRPGDRLIPRNFGREPGQFAVNLVVSKTLPRGLTFAIDGQNILNTTRLVGSSGVLISPVFGRPNRALDGRHLELSLRYTF